MRQFFDHVSDSGDSEGWYWVKQSRTDRIRARTTYTAACNSYFQGLCADGAKRAVYEVTRRQFCDEDSPLWNTALVNFIHDEIIVECPTWKAHEVAIELERVMEDEFNQLVPNVPTRAEAVVMRYWSKKAKRIEKDGRLVPWPEAS
jgi:DNA polymerase I-like protein with 3'-5' exonuclease and polymerase domains